MCVSVCDCMCVCVCVYVYACPNDYYNKSIYDLISYFNKPSPSVPSIT